MIFEKIIEKIEGYSYPHKLLMSVEIKNNPDINSEIIAILNENDVVDYLGERYWDTSLEVSWLKIKTIDGSTGWYFVEYQKQKTWINGFIIVISLLQIIFCIMGRPVSFRSIIIKHCRYLIKEGIRPWKLLR